MDVIENEWYAVRHSGEIPEVALYSAVYYLTSDSNGPGLALTPKQSRMLIQAAEMRYHEIVLRDLQQANRELSEYRGIHRSITNWRRYQIFCGRQQLDSSGFRREVAGRLLLFLTEEVLEVENGYRQTAINCSWGELRDFARELGIAETRLPESVKSLCLP
jgi:hypothetical protein